MSTNRPAPVDNPLTPFGLEKDEKLIENLNIGQLFSSELSLSDFALGITHRHTALPEEIGGDNVRSIFEYLKANDENYAKWQKVKAVDKYGDNNLVVQTVLRDWEHDIEREKRR